MARAYDTMKRFTEIFWLLFMLNRCFFPYIFMSFFLFGFFVINHTRLLVLYLENQNIEEMCIAYVFVRVHALRRISEQEGVIFFGKGYFMKRWIYVREWYMGLSVDQHL